jgi:hypothetical protein
MIYDASYNLFVDVEIDERCVVELSFKDQQISIKINENKWDDEGKSAIIELLKFTQVRSLAEALTDFANKIEEYKKQHP